MSGVKIVKSCAMTGDPCKEERCGWWYNDYEICAVLSIAISLDELQELDRSENLCN